MAVTLASVWMCATAPSADDHAPDPESLLSGRDIYERVIENRFRTFIQTSDLISGDRAGNTQQTRFRMWFEDLSDETREPVQGEVLTQTVIKYLQPFDIRHSGYLVRNHRDDRNDQFVYLASERRIKRVNLRGEAVFGSDFSFEDVLPHSVDDATYRRLPDADINQVPCFVIEAIPKPEIQSEYSRVRLFVEIDRSIPLRVRYWDAREIEIKELAVDRASIERVNDVWVPMRMTMRNLRLETFTMLDVDSIEANPVFGKTTFELRRLEGH